MLKYFFRKAIGVSYLGKPRVIVSVPCNLDDVNRKALTEAIRYAGAKHVFLIEKPFASAIGTGLPVYDPVGNMVVDIGAGTTDVAVISLGGLVVSQSVQVGGDKFDEALVEYLRKECSILVGTQTAENIKKDLATALPLEEDRSILVRGINQLNTSAGTVSFSSAQAYAALQGPCAAIVKAIRWVLERTPPELCADIMRGGIHLTGGVGADIAIEAVGIPLTACNCLEAAASGGKVIFVGNPHGDFTFPQNTYWQILRKQLSIFGTWNSAYSDTHKSDWNLVVDAMAKGMIDAKKLITHKFDLETMDKGLDIMKNNSEFFAKIMVVNQ